jgi:GTP-sensing pleiotropic transcriptional regulator CodY
MSDTILSSYNNALLALSELSIAELEDMESIIKELKQEKGEDTEC